MQVKKCDWYKSMQNQNILHGDECQCNNWYAIGHFTQEYVNKKEILLGWYKRLLEDKIYK